MDDHTMRSSEEWEEEKHRESSKNNKPQTPFSPIFHIKEFKVGNLENASTINIGNNYPSNFKGFKRHSQGLGNIDGDHNDIHDLKSHLNLRYLMDTLMENQDELPEWVKELLNEQEKELKKEDTEFSEDLFEEINSLLGVEETPLFFRKIAKKHELLKKVWNHMNHLWNSDKEFNEFYIDVLKILNQITFSEQYSNVIKLPHSICEGLANEIEELAKTLLAVVPIAHALIPGYIANMKISTLEHPVLNPSHPMETIKSLFLLQEIPPHLMELKNMQEVLKYIYTDIIKPTVESKQVHQYFEDIKNLLDSKGKMAQVLEEDFTSEEQGLLLPELIHCLQNYPKYLFLEFSLLPLCE
ncbi:hypothetical protein [Bacillus sp. AK128]